MTIKTTVADLMTPDVVCLSESQDVVLASAVMKLRRIRHLPVVRGEDELVGLISHRDILRAQAHFLAKLDKESDAEGTRISSVAAKEIMTTDVRCVASDLPADEAAMLLVDHKIGCLPVVDDGKLVGIVTEADFLRWAVGVFASANSGH